MHVVVRGEARDRGGVTYPLVWTGCPGTSVSVVQKSIIAGQVRRRIWRTTVLPSEKGEATRPEPGRRSQSRPRPDR